MPPLAMRAMTYLQLSLLVLVTLCRVCRGHSQQPTPGAVASETKVCSKIGTDVLRSGGNAADAMIATHFCAGVIGMYHSGIGGGGFMLVRSSQGSYESIDFRETAPAAAFQDMYNNNTRLSLFGGLASGVPGALRGIEYLYKNYASFGWKELVMPSVKLAREGFIVTNDLVNYMDATPLNSFLTNDPAWASDFAPNGTLIKLGETMTRKRYADTLETIANRGSDAFYEGAIANATISALAAGGGTMTLEDLRSYTVVTRKPSQIRYRNYTITSTSAPSGGIVALSALNIADGFDFNDPSTVNITTHLLDESIRFAYGQRVNLGDPSFTDLASYQESMLSQNTAAEIRSKISFTRTLNVSAYDPAGYEELPTPGTSHIVTADKSGLAISATTTINLLFGSQLMVPETGVIMNNEMNDFSIPGSSNAFGYLPSPVNYVAPGKRPLSSISPVIVETRDGRLYFITGSAGGSRIITAVVQLLHHTLDEHMTAPEGLAQPRLHDQLVPNQVSFEYDYDNSTVAFMASLGHNVTWESPGGSTAQSLRVLPNGTFEAAGEPRQHDSGGFVVY
ncbi:gamma-glutamyltransferase 1 [Xylariomycetidae sp. FL0641]|nr:gamma-glutamyltransferase 1 [Xylariomycetidae sp. FL0641]